MNDFMIVLTVYGIPVAEVVAIVLAVCWLEAVDRPDWRGRRRPTAGEAGHGFNAAPLRARLAKVRAGHATELCAAGSARERGSRVEAARRIIARLGYFARTHEGDPRGVDRL